MQVLYYLLQKEFRLIFRNPVILRLIIAMPVIQLIIIPFAADYEVRDIKFSVIDLDHSSWSLRLIREMDASIYFRLISPQLDTKQKHKIIDSGMVDMIMTIQKGFEQDLLNGNVATIFLESDAVNGVKAGLSIQYANQIIRQFNENLRLELFPDIPRRDLPVLKTSTQAWYNPGSNYYSFMVPGIMAILVTMVGSFLATLNIVSEKENGTIEQINVTPIRKYQFILGKLIPFWLLGLLSILLSIIIAFLVFNLWPMGSLFLIFLYAGIYLLAVLGIGLLVSTFTKTQQQATLVAFFFMMIFILMGGLYTPIESMPPWAQVIANFNPPSYFIRGVRAIYLMGSDLWDLRKDILITILFAIVFNGLAILNYRKTAV